MYGKKLTANSKTYQPGKIIIPKLKKNNTYDIYTAIHFITTLTIKIPHL